MYGKLFESTFTGSLVGSGPDVFAVWAYVIAHAKPPGEVELNPKLLAMVLGASEASVRAAIDKLCSPDEASRSKDEGGCRLVKTGEYLYRVPTWSKYRAIKNDEERREYNRIKKRESRARQGHVKRDVNDSQRKSAMSAQAEAEAEAEEKAEADTEASGSSPSPASVPTKPVVRKKPKSSPRVRSEPPSESGLVTTGDQEAPKEKPVHVKAIDWFGERFLAQRGVKYEPTALDFTKTAQMLLARKDGSTKTTPTEWARRAEIMLGDEYEGTFKRASPKLLADNWNEFAVAVRRMDKHQQRQMELQAAIERGDI